MNDFQHNLDYKARLISCELLPLTHRRVFLDLSFFMNLLMDHNCLNFDNHFRFLPQTRTRDDLTISPINPYTRYTLFENYFFQRVTNSWNNLPYETRESLVNLEEPNPAKLIIKQFLTQNFIEKFITDSKCTWFLHCTCTNCRIT